jgi:hypothetical protein
MAGDCQPPGLPWVFELAVGAFHHDEPPAAFVPQPKQIPDLHWQRPREARTTSPATTPVVQVRGQRSWLDSVPETGRLPYGRHKGVAETATLVPQG